MKTDKALTTAFNRLTSEQLAAVNMLRHELYVEADRLRDKCRMTRGMHPADADRLMDLICKIPIFER